MSADLTLWTGDEAIRTAKSLCGRPLPCPTHTGLISEYFFSTVE